MYSLSTSGMAKLWFRCFEYYHAYRSGNTFNECLCVVLEQNLQPFFPREPGIKNMQSVFPTCPVVMSWHQNTLMHRSEPGDHLATFCLVVQL